jgi:hypothetical protein
MEPVTYIIRRIDHAVSASASIITAFLTEASHRFAFSPCNPVALPRVERTILHDFFELQADPRRGLADRCDGDERQVEAKPDQRVPPEHATVSLVRSCAQLGDILSHLRTVLLSSIRTVRETADGCTDHLQ